MPIRYEPEAIGNLVEHSAHIRAPSLDASKSYAGPNYSVR